MTLNIQPNLYSLPRQVTETITTTASPETPLSMNAEAIDTFTPSTLPAPNEVEKEEEVASAKEKQPTKKPEKSKASALERRKRIKALEATEKQQAKQEQADAEEIHKAKVSASWWASVPLLIGPIIGLVSNVFVSPESEAKKRTDVRLQNRDETEALEQEQKIKGAKLKAAFVTAVPQLLGFATSWAIGLSLPKPDLSDEKAIFSAAKNPLRYLGIAIGTMCILVPLGYKFFEKPDDPNFNKGL